MIQAIFLTCALAASPMAFANGFTTGDVNGTRAITASVDFLTYMNRNNGKKALLIDGKPEWVPLFRKMGADAFGVLAHHVYQDAPFHVIAKTTMLPFRTGFFSFVYFLSPNPANAAFYPALKEAMTMIEPSGFLIFNQRDYWDWYTLLTHWKWEKLPFTFGDYAIWRRPAFTPGFAFLSSKRHQPVFVGVSQRYVMRAA